MFSKRIIILAIFFIIAIPTVLWFLFDRGEDAVKTGESDDPSAAIFKEEKSEKLDSISTAPPASEQTKKYENIQYGFSFNYLSDFKASEFAEEDGKTVLTIQNAKTGEGLQIYITAYDDPNFVVSKERILSDIPDMPFSSSADVVVGSKAKGVAFFSENETFGGSTAEVWFADGKNFYQATTKAEEVKVLEEIIKSWKFLEN